MSDLTDIKPLIISAPFGNYIQPDGATATCGTFTAAARPGRYWRFIRTVRYYRRLRAWVNKIGLRNPGMPWFVEQCKAGKIDAADKIVSVHGFVADDWWALLDQIAEIKPLAVELNMSCPNVGEVDWPDELFDRAVATGVPVIAKLPPVNYDEMFTQAHAAQIRGFHCCNTLPVPAGGLSGAPLKPVALQCIRDLFGDMPPDDRARLLVIGGGGIRATCDIDDYLAAGVDRVAVATKVCNPIYLFSDAGVRPLIEHATRRLGGTDKGA